MTDDELLELVAAQFRRTGTETPGWPDPHPDMEPPLEEEYSRLLDPGKYRIMRARVDAWQAVLESLEAVMVEPLDAATVPVLRHVPAETAFKWTPTAPDALPVLVTYRSMHAQESTVLEIGAGDPLRLLMAQPECGCDACDDGSDHLLRQIDAFFLHLLSGQLIHVALADGRVQTARDGWDASGEVGVGDPERIITDARAGISPHDVTRGAPWL
jgi:hypothetical protein